jgi:TonB family protein
VLSLLLHLLILWLFTKKFDELKFLPPQKQEKKISLNLKQVVTPPLAPRPKPMSKPVVTPAVPKPVLKPIIEKEVEPIPEVEEVKRTILDESTKTFVTKSTEENNVTKVVKKPVKKVVKKKVIKKPKKKLVKKKVTKKKYIAKRKPLKRRVRRSKDPLANMLMGTGTSLNPKPFHRASFASSTKRIIKKLYGSEFNTFTPAQKKFIRNNLSAIHRITQRTLTRNGYPDVAIQTKQQGVNVVTFYLHPNGDISGLKLKKRIGYEALDRNTLKVIRLAYKDYPLPNQKTKIVFYVNYSLY